MAYGTAFEALLTVLVMFRYGELSLIWCFGKIKTKRNISDWYRSNYKKMQFLYKSNLPLFGFVSEDPGTKFTC